MSFITYSESELLQTADTDKRSYILITDRETKRRADQSDASFIGGLNEDYKIRKNGTLPYHYVLTPDDKVLPVKPDFTRITTLPYSGFPDDVLVLSEKKLDNLDDVGVKKLAQLCANICQKYFVNTKDIRIIDYYSNEFFTHENTTEKIIEETEKILESIDPLYIIKHNFDKEGGSATFLIPDSILTALEVSDIAGVPQEVIEAQNQKELTRTKRSLAMFRSANFAKIKNQPTYGQGAKVAVPNTTKITAPRASNAALNSSRGISTYMMDSVLFTSVYAKKQNNKTVGQEVTNNLNLIRTQSGSLKRWNEGEIKPYKRSATLAPTLPGYKNAYFEFINKVTGETRMIGFMVSPNSVSSTRTTTQQINKTMGGYFIMRTGKAPEQLSITGYMLDTAECQERNDFIEEYYKAYIEDKRNANNEYFNNYAVNLIIEGRKYFGILQNLTTQKSSAQQFLYQYTISFLALDDILLYRTASATAGLKQDFTTKGKSDFKGEDQRVFLGPGASELLKV